MQFASRAFEINDIEDAIELCYEQRWTDGLPVVPPTHRAIERILTYLGRDPNEVIGVVPPRNGIATIEKIASKRGVVEEIMRLATRPVREVRHRRSISKAHRNRINHS